VHKVSWTQVYLRVTHRRDHLGTCRGLTCTDLAYTVVHENASKQAQMSFGPTFQFRRLIMYNNTVSDTDGFPDISLVTSLSCHGSEPSSKVHPKV